MDVAFLEVMSSCPRCGAKLPVNRPAQSQSCTHCYAEESVSELVWSSTVGGLRQKLGDVGRGGFARATFQSPAVQLSWLFGRGTPPCPRCQGETRLHESSGPAWQLLCARCGTPTALQPVPDWLRRYDATVAAMLTPPDQVSSSAPVITVRCTNCGSALNADGSVRSVPCAFCRTTNLLSDEVWQVFHPPRRMQRWWLVLQAPLRPSSDAESPVRLATPLFATLFLGPFAVCFILGGGVGVLGFGAAAGLFGALGVGSSSLVDGASGLAGGLGFGIGAVGFGIGVLAFGIMFLMGVVALVALLWVYLATFRMRRRERLLRDAKCELVGRIRVRGPRTGNKVQVEVACSLPNGPGQVLALKRDSLPQETLDRLGGDGSSVRAWVDPSKPKHCEVKWEPSPLVD